MKKILGNKNDQAHPSKLSKAISGGIRQDLGKRRLPALHM
jgi:hypothetical protein